MHRLHSINNGYDTTTWNNMVSIKQRILDIWEHAPPTVRICCIKFAQRVVLSQSVASGAEPRVRMDDGALHHCSRKMTADMELFSMALLTFHWTRYQRTTKHLIPRPCKLRAWAS